MESVKQPKALAMKEKRCCACGETKAAGEFHSYAYTTNQGKRSIRFGSRCMACQNAFRNRLRASKPEHERAVTAAWKEANKAHIAAYRRGLTGERRERLLASRRLSELKRRVRGYNRCVKSVKAVSELALEMARVGDKYLDAYDGSLIDKPSIDHIEPLYSGGDHSYENVCVTSFENNRRKGRMPFLLWMARKRGVLRHAS